MISSCLISGVTLVSVPNSPLASGSRRRERRGPLDFRFRLGRQQSRSHRAAPPQGILVCAGRARASEALSFKQMVRQLAISARDIARIVKSGQLSMLVGSGVSCSCGLASWGKLVTDMRVELLRNCAQADLKELRRFLSSATPLKIAGLYKERQGEVAYSQFLRKRFRHPTPTRSPMLKAIAQMPIGTLFTTNFDKLLETACRPAVTALDPIVVTDPSQLPGLHPREKRIVKIHGDVDYPKGIILTDEDYLHYDDKYQSLALYFTGHLAFSTMLLVGFGLRDPNFDRIYSGARRIVQGAGPRVIALMAKQNRFERQTWTSKGLLVNDFDDYADITAFLRQIVRFC
jgi:hypothetical protein